MSKLTKKQTSNISDIIKSSHKEILDIIMENGFIIKQENWNEKQMEFRAIYDSFRIINIIKDKLINL